MRHCEEPTPPLISAEDELGVRVLTASHGALNTLSRALRLAAIQALQSAAQEPEVRALVLRCAGRTFFAGADLAELQSGLQPPGLLEFVDACAAARAPVIAALHGSVFGGGVVMAYACDWRVAAEDARFAMPEVGLGLVPTFGGTQLLPRLIGVPAALELVIDGAEWDAATALRRGLVDEVVPASQLDLAARAAARRLPPKRPVRSLQRHLEAPEATALALAARRGALPPDAPAARALCLQLFAEGLQQAQELALAWEHEAFLAMLASAQSWRLRELFLAERGLRRAAFDIAAVQAQLRITGPEPQALRALARRLLTQGAVPSARLLDALVVQTFGLPRHQPSPLEPLLHEEPQ